jgi:hypothetical protein
LKSPIDISPLTEKGYQVDFYFHAAAILFIDFPEAWDELCQCLLGFDIPMGELIGSGGGEAKGTQRLRRTLNDLDWVKTNFTIDKTINGVRRESVSHEVDHVKSFGDQGLVALEIEWNNKDPFFDRDLENYKRLHAEGAIDVGVIITRGRSLQDGLPSMVQRYLEENAVAGFDGLVAHGYIPTPKQRTAINQLVERENNPMTFRDAFSRKFVSDKFGKATTHWSKLEDRVSRGVGNPCPLVLIGLPDTIVSFDGGET